MSLPEQTTQSVGDQRAGTQPESASEELGQRALLWRMVCQLWRFGFASGASLVAIVGLTAFFHHALHWSSNWAYGVTLIVVFTANFLVLRYWVYRELESEGRLMSQFVLVACFSAIFRSLEYVGFLGLHGQLDWPWLVAVLCVSILSFAVKFFVYRQLVFGKQRWSTGAIES